MNTFSLNNNFVQFDLNEKRPAILWNASWLGKDSVS
jgi:hypothetical protein